MRKFPMRSLTAGYKLEAGIAQIFH
jgi:hypothetical protein